VGGCLQASGATPLARHKPEQRLHCKRQRVLTVVVL
jgi:hypothetical protein